MTGIQQTLKFLVWIHHGIPVLDNFHERGWDEIMFAYSYKYVKGSLFDYAIKKLNLLLDADSELTERSRINHIVYGLPAFVRAKLNRRDIVTQSDLMVELGQLESLVSKPKSRFPYGNNNKFDTNQKTSNLKEDTSRVLFAQNWVFRVVITLNVNVEIKIVRKMLREISK